MNKPMSFRIVGMVSDKSELKDIKNIMEYAVCGMHIRDLPKHSIKYE